MRRPGLVGDGADEEEEDGGLTRKMPSLIDHSLNTEVPDKFNGRDNSILHLEIHMFY